MRQMRTVSVIGWSLAFLLGLVALAMSATTTFAANEPSITFDAATYDYGNIAANTPVSQTFVLTNGKRATGELTVSLTGSAAFTKTIDGCTGTRLPANKSCSVTVQYTRATMLTFDSAALFAASNKPLLNAFVTLTGGLSEGCAQVNDVQFDGAYINAGVNLPFKAGEVLAMSSDVPTDGTPAQVILKVGTDVVDTADFPGTVEYTIPAGGSYAIGWGTDGNIAITTWVAGCVGP